MDSQAAELFAEAKRVHTKVITALVGLRERSKASTDLKELADLAYAMDKCDKYLSEAAKLCRQLGALAEKQACSQWLSSAEAAGDVERSIHTEYVRATPHVKMLATLPRRKDQPVEYAAMLDDLGVPRELWEGKTHATVEPHWPGLMDRISERLAEGKPLPKGVDPEKTYPEYSLHLYGKKGPDE